MLFVFLVLYVVLATSCLVFGIRRRSRAAVVCGIVALALSVLSLAIWALSLMGSDHWAVSLLELLLSPMPETITAPGELAGVTTQTGIPLAVVAVIELLGSIVLWAIPVLGLVAASRSPRAVRA